MIHLLVNILVFVIDQGEDKSRIRTTPLPKFGRLPEI